jgi:hypothetical protein
MVKSSMRKAVGMKDLNPFRKQQSDWSLLSKAKGWMELDIKRALRFMLRTWHLFCGQQSGTK